MLKISYAGCLGLSPAISSQFNLEMRVAAQNRDKFTKTPYFGGSRSSVFTLKSLSSVLVMISSMSVSICNDFHVRRASSGKLKPSEAVPLFRPLVCGPL